MNWVVLGRVLLLVALVFGGYMLWYIGTTSPLEIAMVRSGLDLAAAKVAEAIVFFALVTIGIKLIVVSRRS